MTNTNKFQASKNLQNLFVELVKIELSKYEKTTLNMVANIIKFYAEMDGFNQCNIVYWHCVCGAHNVKYNA